MKKWIILVCCLLLLMLGGCNNDKEKTDMTVNVADIETWSCEDVTSYDRNWNNDMKCVSSKGRQKYTSYEGARQLESL